MNPSSPAPCVMRRLARAAASALFISAALFISLALSGASARAKSHGPAKGGRRAAARRTQARAKKEVAHRRGPAAEESEPGNVPGVGEEAGDNVFQREEWFRFQRAYPFDDVPADARRQAWESRPKGKLKPSALRGALSAEAVQWTPIGPSPMTSAFSTRWGLTSGHVRAVAVKPDDPNVVLIGSASGGVWRSADGGATFAPVTDSQVDLAVGAIAFAPGNPSVVYAGMGAQSGFGSYLGTGVLKSTDAGATWFRVDTAGLTSRGRSVSIAVDPTDPNRVYLCHFLKQVTDASSTTNSDGLYVSTDGGSTWMRTFAGLPEVVLVSPADPNVVFMSTGRDDNTAAHLAGVYKSTDRGLTWTNSYSIGVVTSPNLKDCYVAVTPADPKRVYAVSRGASSSSLSVSYTTDGGASWTTPADVTTIDTGQWGYNSYVYASPANADTIYVGTRDVWRSTDKGATWTNLTNNFTAAGNYQPNSSFAHPDQHSFAFAPGDGSTFYVGNDGGLWKTTTGGTVPAGSPADFKPFTSLNASLTLQQFVGITAHPTTPGVTYGGTQDNGTQVRAQDAAGWREFASGDGGRVTVVPSDPTVVFPSYVNGTIWRYKDSGSGPAFQKTVGSSSVFKDAATGAADRIPFYPPIVTNGADSTLYVGTHRLWVSKDLGDSWAAPGGTADLSFAPTVDCTASPKPAKCGDVLSAVGVSRSNPQVIYTGSAQGRLMVSQDGGANWADLTANFTAPSGTATRFVSSITVDPANPAAAYVTVSGFGTGHVWKTTNAGQTWADLSGANAATKLPNIPTSALLLDPAAPGVIYVGTDVGVFRSAGDGNWEALANGLPPVPVSSFAVNAAGKIQIGTFGRGAYELTSVVAAPPAVQFAGLTFTPREGDNPRADVTVVRSGDTSGTSSVDARTVDDPRPVRCDDTSTAPGVAFARCDYATTVQTLVFAPGEQTKTFSIPVIDDAFVEPDESVQLALSNPVGATLGARSTTTLVIRDNDAPGEPNPLNNTDFFVRMQYLDFLSREPEAGQPWSGVINNCPAGDASCDRISVSANFFRSQEFQLKGLFVFKFYRVAFNRMPLYAEIIPDMSSVTGATTAELVAKKAAFAAAFAQRPEFTNLYGAMSNQQFVDALLGRYGLQQVTTINPATPDDTAAPRVVLTRAALVSQLTAGVLTRGQVLRAVADSTEVGQAELNPAFVAMQYFGYLRRDPEPSGYQAWLNTINANPSDFRAMVNGFMNSAEYRLRFGQP